MKACILRSARELAVEDALELTRPGGTIVQIGNFPSGPVSAPLNRILAKELRLQGSFRFDREYATAVQAMQVSLRPA